jgi:Cu+-exporting ATPase
MKLKSKSLFYGFGASILVLLINFVVLYLLNFPPMATQIIKSYWYLLVLLIGGFGVQIGMFVYHKNFLSCSTTVASGSISAFSMILCCSHYLLNILPMLGALIGASFLMDLGRYTVYFLLLGIVSNVIGVSIMFRQIKRKGGFRK